MLLIVLSVMSLNTKPIMNQNPRLLPTLEASGETDEAQCQVQRVIHRQLRILKERRGLRQMITNLRTYLY
jgi:hypothetical protein